MLYTAVVAAESKSDRGRQIVPESCDIHGHHELQKIKVFTRRENIESRAIELRPSIPMSAVDATVWLACASPVVQTCFASGVPEWQIHRPQS
jgi:hypothetical protein